MKTKDCIEIKGAKVNNLKGVDVSIPRDRLVVVTGLSGSGKSSLVFDTLYAEGQRRYVESLSAYARQFLERMGKPECEYIKGIPPAVAIEQKTGSRNTRSTVGTVTEIYDYLRLLYARIGKTYSPISGNCVRKFHIDDMVDRVFSYPEGTRFVILSPLLTEENENVVQLLQVQIQKGFSRVEICGENFMIEEVLEQPGLLSKGDLFLVIDRLVVQDDNPTRSRTVDSIEAALFEGNRSCAARFRTRQGEELVFFSDRFEADGVIFEEPSDLMFNFNSPVGACPLCGGTGLYTGVNEALVIPDETRSVYQDAVACWAKPRTAFWKDQFMNRAVEIGFPIHTSYKDLTADQLTFLWKGDDQVGGIDQFFEHINKGAPSFALYAIRDQFIGKHLCPECKGGRLKKESTYVRIGGKSMVDLSRMPIKDLIPFFSTLQLSPTDKEVAKRLLHEIEKRILLLDKVGLNYLTLGRSAGTLSGGESQRIRLSTSLSSTLVGSLYILDEPSIGLHPRDTRRLIDVLKNLRDIGNTVVVVEHDEEMMHAADYLIDIGPLAGRLGGEVIFQGTAQELSTVLDKSLTAQYIMGTRKVEIPAQRLKWNQYIELKNASGNNLKGFDIKFPLHLMTVVTGVSGSGKSTLVHDAFYNNLLRTIEFGPSAKFDKNCIGGDFASIKGVEMIDQAPIGRTTRSNPVTYIKAFDDIRKLFAEQPLSKQMGYGVGHFSFNIEGGRCEACQGEGTVTVSMQFMADLTMTCQECEGKRYKKDILEVLYRQQSIHDVLEMTVDQAIEFFKADNAHTPQKIAKFLQPLHDVGLGYVCLGQSSSSLSGGESQRVKLASFLTKKENQSTLYIFDEPTTGLHIHDINTLLKAFRALIAQGDSVLVIEHNMEVIKSADWIIDLGPEGGEEGGMLVGCGTPEELAKIDTSHTGRFLKEYLCNQNVVF